MTIIIVMAITDPGNIVESAVFSDGSQGYGTALQDTVLASVLVLQLYGSLLAGIIPGPPSAQSTEEYLHKRTPGENVRQKSSVLTGPVERCKKHLSTARVQQL